MEPLLRFLKPATAELDREVARDRYCGALLGLAVGNALGDVVEGLSDAEIGEGAAGRQGAGKGAVMRCAPVGLRWRRDPVRLVEDAGHSARVTHYDPRCVWTTTAAWAGVAPAPGGGA